MMARNRKKTTLLLDVSDKDFLKGFGGTEAEAREALALLVADAKAAGMDPIAFLDLAISDKDVIDGEGAS